VPIPIVDPDNPAWMNDLVYGLGRRGPLEAGDCQDSKQYTMRR